MTKLHPQLAADCLELGRFSLCRVLLRLDANFLWLILVPDRDGITEIYQLSLDDQVQLIRESSTVARRLATRFQADKINVAALGNVVPQLHVHHVIRYRSDPAWPNPVWGCLPEKAYEPAVLKSTVANLRACFAEEPDFSIAEQRVGVPE